MADRPALETEVERLREENARLREALGEFRGNVSEHLAGLNRAIERVEDLLPLY